ncbi:MAG: hypothetical protein JXO72_07855 [Vicinamibacteria bacterium]|nr:hypothetical protein [Vicinamibacteria bacterium]
MRRRLFLFMLFVFLVAPREGVCAQEWYEHYLSAQRQFKAFRYTAALRSLNEAVRIKPMSALGEQTYGLQFIDYLPYYYLGLCHHRMGDYQNAVTSFDKEESLGFIRQRSRLFHDLQERRKEAQSEIDRLERQIFVQRAREKVDALTKRSTALARARRYEEALILLAEAEQASSALDPLTQRMIADRISDYRELKTRQDQSEARRRQIDQMLEEGHRLQESGQDKEAIVQFDGVLRLDPTNQPASEGKREASDRILVRTTRQQRRESFERGKALVDGGRYEEALDHLAEAAADASNEDAKALLDRAQKAVARLRRQRDIRMEIERRMDAGERLLSLNKPDAARVQFQNVLELDATHARAIERAAYAERMSEQTLFEKWRPNQAPVLTFFQPQETSAEITKPTATIEGVATDDRGLAKLEFYLSSQLVAEHVIPPRLDGGDPQRHMPFKRELALSPGPNEIRVRATDILGVEQEQSFQISRRLRFHETQAFLPSALVSSLSVLLVILVVVRVRRKHAVRSRFNPYIAGAPVMNDHMFFGRQKLVERILGLLPHNSLMITGERRIGKTSLLYHLKRVLEVDSGSDYRFFPVFTDLQGVNETGLFEALMGDILEELKPDPALSDELRHNHAQERYEGRDFGHDLQLIISDLKRRSVKKVRLVLLIDEVDVLNDYSERTNQQFRSTFMKTFSEHLVAVMSGVDLKRGWRGEGSPWYNFFEQINLSPLTHEEARDLVRNPVANVFRYENDAVDRILDHSQLKPYLIQKFCIQSLNRMLDDGRTIVTASDVEAVRDSLTALADGGGLTEPESPLLWQTRSS